jgi:hypothetical protein
MGVLNETVNNGMILFLLACEGSQADKELKSPSLDS